MRSHTTGSHFQLDLATAAGVQEPSLYHSLPSSALLASPEESKSASDPSVYRLVMDDTDDLVERWIAK